MTIGQKIDADIITAMKAKEEHKLTTLRMVKSALKNKAIDKRAELTNVEESQILTTLIKQRRESVESFTKGNRPELAEKERAEIVMIEGYLPERSGRRRDSHGRPGSHRAARRGRNQAGAEGYGRGDEDHPAANSGQWAARRRQAGERAGEGRVGEVALLRKSCQGARVGTCSQAAESAGVVGRRILPIRLPRIAILNG